MDLRTIKKLQRIYGYADTQKRIEDGSIWKFDGSVGRHTMELLEAGVCFLGTKFTFDYYGNKIPPRSVVKEGSKGSRLNAINFWKKVENGEIDMHEID